MSEMTRDELVKTLARYKNRVIDTWDYANKDSYLYPKMGEKEAAEKERLDAVLAHDAAQRETIQRLENRLRVLAEVIRRARVDGQLATERQLADAQAEVARLKGQIVVDEESHY